MNSKFLIYTDCGPGVGNGHIMRMLALKEEVESRGMQVVLAGPSQQELFGLKIRTFDSSQLALQFQECSWVCFDLYKDCKDLILQAKALGCKVMIVADSEIVLDGPDIYLNPNLHAIKEFGSPLTSAIELRGWPYFLSRRSILELSRSRDKSEIQQQMLIYVGGSYPEALNIRICQALCTANFDFKIHFITGSDLSFFEAASSILKDMKNVIVSPQNQGFDCILAKSRSILCSASVVASEAALLGLNCETITVANNQIPVAKALQDFKVANNLGNWSELNIIEIQESIQRLGSKLGSVDSGSPRLDSLGAKRVVDCLEANQLALRPARDCDLKFLFDLANDPQVRANAFSTQKIEWNAHLKWWESKKQFEGRLILIAQLLNFGCCGQIRFDLKDNKFLIDYALESRVCGKGFGKQLLLLGCHYVYNLTRVNIFVAEVKSGNLASVKALIGAGFREVRSYKRDGEWIQEFELDHLLYDA